MTPRLPVGTSDFAQLRQDGLVYVDKTGLIAELVHSSMRVVLLPRPRRFGKTLNLSTLRYWFERTDEDRRGLFEGLEVAASGEDVAARFQRHPVIFLTFKDVKASTWAKCHADVADLIREEVVRLEPVWSAGALPEDARETLEALARGEATDTQLHKALRTLTRALHLASGEEAVLLIDEYDTPIHSGWLHDYYDPVIELFRGLLSGGLKDNKHLYRGVLTGILRVAKESIFSGLNNIAVHSLLSRPFSRWFGFTEEDVDALCATVGPDADRDGIRHWYNGYRMGDRVVYNPWSVLCYLSSVDNGFQPYWVNTASNDLLRRVLVRSGLPVHQEIVRLIHGEEIVAPLSEDVQLREIGRNTREIWSFLLFSGYLKARDPRRENEQLVAQLSIPNREVVSTYRQIFLRWLEEGLGGPADVEALGRSLLAGDAPGFRARLQRLVVESLSYFDVGGRRPEAVYQAFLVGLLVHLSPTHLVDSNRESGYGRYDVCVRPRAPGGPGAVLELKRIPASVGPRAVRALHAAMAQVKDRAYATALRQAGAEPVWQWGAVFDGKKVWVRVERG